MGSSSLSCWLLALPSPQLNWLHIATACVRFDAPSQRPCYCSDKPSPRSFDFGSGKLNALPACQSSYSSLGPHVTGLREAVKLLSYSCMYYQTQPLASPNLMRLLFRRDDPAAQPLCTRAKSKLCCRSPARAKLGPGARPMSAVGLELGCARSCSAVCLRGQLY